MGKCRKCGEEARVNSRICNKCLDDWSNMRIEIFNKLQEKYGKMNQTNHPTFIKETKRLERIWRKDKQKFVTELESL